MQNIMTKAINCCMEAGVSLTPKRLLIFKAIAEYGAPIAAYELQDLINRTGHELNIATIYRVIEFWCNLSMVHKVAPLNKYVVCSEPEEKHTHMLNFCTICESVFETCNERMGLDLEKSFESMGFKLNKTSHVEIPVICIACEG